MAGFFKVLKSTPISNGSGNNIILQHVFTQQRKGFLDFREKVRVKGRREGIVGPRDGSSPMTWPIYRRDDDTIDWRLTFSDTGSLYRRRNIENAKVSLRYGWETAYEEEIGGMHFLLGGGATKNQIKRHLFEYVMVPLMLAGAKGGGSVLIVLGAGGCLNYHSATSRPLTSCARWGTCLNWWGGDAVDAARVAFVDALRLFLLLAAPTPECAVCCLSVTPVSGVWDMFGWR
eukprot:scaffold1717_cov62-Cyclotella_meneghiniana.AAC.2